MSYRNDHEAAVARIAALEQMLAEAQDQAHEKARQDRGRIAMLERELEQLKRHAPQPRLPRKQPAPAPAPREADTRAPIDELSLRGAFATVIFLALAAGGLVYLVSLFVR